MTHHQNICPYTGLRSFTEEESVYFKGRDLQVDQITALLEQNKFLMVTGASGEGKSSLIYAGLVPNARAGFFRAKYTNWVVADFRPERNPVHNMAAALAKTFNSQSATIETELRRGFSSLVDIYTNSVFFIDEKDSQWQELDEPERKNKKRKAANLLLIVDQFEEFFTNPENFFNEAPSQDSQIVVNLVLETARIAIKRNVPVYVICTMRSDYIGQCSAFRGLPEYIGFSQFFVPRLKRKDLKQVIEEPAILSGNQISQRLIERLVYDMAEGVDQLPILQHAMMRTWDAWYKKNQHATPIDFKDYEKIGTMQYALSQHAEEAYDELKTDKEQRVCGLMFKALTDKSADSRGVRRPRTITDLSMLTGAEEAEICKQVEIFRKPGRTFLMPHPHIPLSSNTIIDISHESLMRVWDRLVLWADEEARSGDLYMRLINSAELKEQGQRGLLKDPELEIALKWLAKNKPTYKWAEGYKGNFEKAMAYLEESRIKDIAEKEELARIEQERLQAEKVAARRKLKNVIAILLLLLLIGASVSTFRYRAISQLAANQRDSALVQKEKAQLLQKKADSLANIALKEKSKSDTNALIAEDARDSALIEKTKADSLKKIADSSAEKERISADSAEQRKIRADFLKEETKKQGYKNAPSEYARLIREGPVTLKEIQKDRFDYKLLAYCMHLDTLQSLIKSTGDKNALAAYNNLRERLYYNNDLYEKLYACLETISDVKAKKSVFDKLNTPYTGFNDETTITDPVYASISTQSGKNIVALTQGEDDQRIICSTGDNWIYVYTSAKNLVLENKIPMGAKVTALFYNSLQHIIYFGLESGDIGYIRYGKNNKNQPIFENALGSPVTAIQLFNYPDAGGNNYFLLAAARKSKAVVYELDENNLLPDKRLLGNILPERNLVEIVDVRFDNDLKKVVIKVRSLKTKNETIYAWDPFTSSVLEKYRQYKNMSDFEKKYLEPTNIYNNE